MFSLAILAIVLAYTWVLAPIAPRWTAAVAGALVVALAVARALKTGEWGLRPSAFLPALWRAAAFTAAAALANGAKRAQNAHAHASVADDERVAIGCRTGDAADAKTTVRASDIFDYDGLAQ